jgi:acetylglutamate kinase
VSLELEARTALKQVIKIGGTLLEDPAGRARIAALLAARTRPGWRTLVVHGGGKQLTAYLERAGMQSEFVNGLRVTSAEALDAVVKVFAGTVNHSLLAALHAAGVPAIGISGIDGGCLQAERLRGDRGEDWGSVGRITRANPRVWEAQLAAGFLPVLACVAVGVDGQIYNVNADQAAVACAVYWQADSLVFLTDVDGVRDRAGHVLPQLSAEQIPELIRSGAVAGGMLAKLNAVREALDGGISQVRIVNGHTVGPADLARFDAEPGASSLGTVMVSPLATAKKR